MRPVYPKFTAGELSALIDEYFIFINGRYRKLRRLAKKGPNKTMTVTVCDREPEPATITGLALYLGFTSIQEFDRYGQKGRHAKILRRGKLRIEAIYEKMLHAHFTSGPIFVLRSLGWNETKTTDAAVPHSLNIKITDSGPAPVGSEKEVIIHDQPHPSPIPMNQ